MNTNALYARSFSQCDSFLIGSKAYIAAYPYFDSSNIYSTIEHEATLSRINDDEIFYLVQRGINKEQAISLIISGFCKDILVLLPQEFAIEANKLLLFKLEDTLG